MGDVTATISALWSRLRGKKRPAKQQAKIAYLPGGDRIVWGFSDRDMDGAIAAAKATLPVFWAWHESRPDDPDSCALKVRFPTEGDGAEHIWFIDILRTGDLATGIVASEPDRVPDLKPGQPAVIDVEQITDWTFRKEGLYHGHFTTRVLAASHPDVAARKRALSENPLPGDLVRH
jgi:uncharacterized protein YegJ (DUF2314 family)